MEKKNLSDQDKRNYLAQNGWDVYEEVSDIKNARYVPKSLFNSAFTPLSLEDAYAFCMRLEYAAKERFKESEYKPESILDEEVKKERPNDLSIDEVEFERLKKHEEFSIGNNPKNMWQSVCQTQTVEIPLDHYYYFLRIAREHGERDLVKEVLEPKHFEKEERKCSTVSETPFLTTFINVEKEQTERLFELFEMIAGKLDSLIPLKEYSITDNPCGDYSGQLGMLRTFQESRANLIGKFEFLLINLQRII